jgi:hypothetical protein
MGLLANRVGDNRLVFLVDMRPNRKAKIRLSALAARAIPLFMGGDQEELECFLGAILEAPDGRGLVGCPHPGRQMDDPIAQRPQHLGGALTLRTRQPSSPSVTSRT